MFFKGYNENMKNTHMQSKNTAVNFRISTKNKNIIQKESININMHDKSYSFKMTALLYSWLQFDYSKAYCNYGCIYQVNKCNKQGSYESEAEY